MKGMYLPLKALSIIQNGTFHYVVKHVTEKNVATLY